MSRQKSNHVDSPEAVGERIKAARLRAGLIQRDLAFPGCTSAYISRIEAGARIPSLQVLEEIGRRLGVSAAYLARGGAPSRGALELTDAQLAQRLGKLDDAAEAYERLLESGEAAVRKASLLGLGEIALAQGRIERAIALLEEHDTVPPRQVDPAAVEVLSRAYLTRGDRSKALAILEEALGAVEDDVLARFRISILLGNALIDAAELDRAEHVLNDALESLGPSPDPIAFARFLWSQSRLQTARGSTDTAARYAEQALSIVKSTEHVEYAARAHHLVAYIELERGNPQGALEALERAEPLIELAGDRPAAALFRLERARALVALGAFDEAKALAEELVREAEGLSPVDSARALAVIARVFAAAGETQRALGLYEAAADVLADLESAPMLVSVYSEWSDLLADAGRTDEALEVARRGMHSRLGGASRI